MALRDFRNHHVINLRCWLKQRREDLINDHRDHGTTYGIVFREQWDLRAETYFTTGGNKQCHIIFVSRFEMKYKYVGSTSMPVIDESVQLLLAEFSEQTTRFTPVGTMSNI
jgi:hypothetical protein